MKSFLTIIASACLLFSMGCEKSTHQPDAAAPPPKQRRQGLVLPSALAVMKIGESKKANILMPGGTGKENISYRIINSSGEASLSNGMIVPTKTGSVKLVVKIGADENYEASENSFDILISQNIIIEKIKLKNPSLNYSLKIGKTTMLDLSTVFEFDGDHAAESKIEYSCNSSAARIKGNILTVLHAAEDIDIKAISTGGGNANVAYWKGEASKIITIQKGAARAILTLNKFKTPTTLDLMTPKTDMSDVFTVSGVGKVVTKAVRSNTSLPADAKSASSEADLGLLFIYTGEVTLRKPGVCKILIYISPNPDYEDTKPILSDVITVKKITLMPTLNHTTLSLSVRGHSLPNQGSNRALNFNEYVSYNVNGKPFDTSTYQPYYYVLKELALANIQDTNEFASENQSYYNHLDGIVKFHKNVTSIKEGDEIRVRAKYPSSDLIEADPFNFTVTLIE